MDKNALYATISSKIKSLKELYPAYGENPMNIFLRCCVSNRISTITRPCHSMIVILRIFLLIL